MMTEESIHFEDFPPYDKSFIKAIAFACCFILSPIFLLLILVEPSIGLWSLLLWILVPALTMAIPYLFAVPTKIELTSHALRIRHGLLWNIRIPLSDITDCDALDAAPWWANFQYFYPYAQWMRIFKSRGLFKRWYVPTTSATKLILEIRKVMQSVSI